MKKFLLFAAAFSFVAANVSAANLIKNGSFNEPGYEQSVPSGYTWDPWDKQLELTFLPNWSLKTGGCWNGGCTIITDEPGDGDLRDEEDTVYLNMWGYNDNGWDKIQISQVVEGLEVGKEYTFSYVYCYNFPTSEQTANGWAPDPSYGANICEVDDTGADVMAGKTIVSIPNPNGDEFSSYDEWLDCSQTFTASTDKVWVEIYIGNYYGDKNKKDGLYMDVDNVVLSDGGDNAVKAVIFDKNAPVEYYNLQGVRVNVSDNTRGIVIRKQGNNVSKVAL